MKTTKLRTIALTTTALLVTVSNLRTSQAATAPPLGASRTSAFALTQRTNFSRPPRSMDSRTNIASKAVERGAQDRNLVLTKIGPDFEIWTSTNASPQGFSATNPPAKQRQVVNIATGMNFWDGSQWSKSEASFHPTPAGDAFVADRVQHTSRLEAELNTAGAVSVTLPDGNGRVLHTTPVAIGIYDAASGRIAILASVTNSTATLISSNKVLFPNAFQENGVCASVIYTIKNGSFEQDVVITGHFDPADYGFPVESQLQVFTEIYDNIEPTQIERTIPDQHDVSARRPDRVDYMLDFGKFVLGAGRAHTMRASITGTNIDAPVTKQFRTIEGRRFLVEALDVAPELDVLQALPSCGQTAALRLKSKFKNASVGYASIPQAGSSKQMASKGLKQGNAQDEILRKPQKVEIALGSSAPSGLVIDYVSTLDSTMHPTLFQSDITYFVSGPVYCNGLVTLEAAVFKFPYYSGAEGQGIPSTTAFISINNGIVCKTAEYFPAIFTSADDITEGDNVGTWDLDGNPHSDVWSPWTGIIRGFYGNPYLLINCPNASLSNIRFRYAQQAIRFDGTTALGGTPYTLAHSQIVNSRNGITLTGTLPAQSNTNNDQSAIAPRSARLLASLFEFVGGVAYCSAPPPQPGQPYNIAINNCLLVATTNPVTIIVPVNATFTHCTFDQDQVATPGPLVSSSTPSWVTTPTATFVNCILANMPTASAGLVSLGGHHNGFYNSFGGTTFGTSPVGPPTTPPFQQSIPGTGNHYLADTAFRHAGSALISSSLLNDLKTRTTQPPDTATFPTASDVTQDISLSPQVPRYQTGTAPDLGYWYDALDYTLSGAWVNSRINVAPNTAIGIRNDFADVDPVTGHNRSYYIGFVLEENATFVAHGTPNAPITFTAARLVQEGGAKYPATVAFSGDFEGDDYLDAPPRLSFRFCNFSFEQLDCHLLTGHAAPYRADSDSFTPPACMNWSLQDCTLRSGYLGVKSGEFSPPGSISWANNYFERCNINLSPTAWPPGLNLDFVFLAYNNLFKAGLIKLWPNPSSKGDWIFQDNLFDSVLFWQTPPDLLSLPLNHHHNAYWLYSLSGSEPIGYGNRLVSANYAGNHDVILNSAPPYQTSTFGNFYLPTSYGTWNAGSRSPAEAGFSQYTTRTDQVKEADESGSPNMVNIGLHYVAASGGSPVSTLVTGVPDYVADADGNGSVDATETPGPLAPGASVTKANNDVFQVQQNSTANILPVLVNDTDSQGFSATIWYPTGIVATAHGTVGPSSDGLSLVYTPTPGSTYYGPDTFTYAMVNDFNHESSATNTVFINNTAQNNAPPTILGPCLATLGPNDTTATITILNCVSDSDGPAIKLVSVGQPQLGSAIISGSPYSGTVLYTRGASIAGTDTFTYTVTDDNGGCAIGTIQVNRNTSLNHAPVALSYSTTAIQSLPLDLKLLASDQDNNTLTYTVLQSPQHGTLSGSPPNYSYTPAANYYGPDYLTFKVNDGSLDSLPATITIHDQFDQSSPFPDPQSVLVLRNTATPIRLSAFDPEGDYLTFHAENNPPSFPTQAPAHGTLSGTPPNLIYTPDNNFVGHDSFTFWASDGLWYSQGPETVSINVIPPLPTGLVAANDIFQVQQGSLSTDPANTLDVLANDTDYDDYPLTIDPPSPATTTHGTIALSANSTRIAYAPSDPNFFGSDTFNYVARDDHSRTANAQVTVFINKTGNNNPIAGLYTTNLDRGQVALAVNISDLLANYCSDLDSGDTLTLLSLTQPKMGSAVNNSGGFIIYTRNAYKYGMDSFAYTVTDGNGGFAIGEITIDQIDTDGDGIPDAWELDHGLNPDDPSDSGLDVDGDRLTNLAEYQLNTDPWVPYNPLDIAATALPDTASGTIQIDLSVAPDLDEQSLEGMLFPLTLLVDGNLARSRVTKVNGKWVAELDTSGVQNGQHRLSLSLACINTTDEGWTEYAAYGWPRALSISNAITVTEFSRRYTDQLNLQARVNVNASSYRIEIYDAATSEHLKTVTGVAPNRNISTSWNLLNDSGNKTSAECLRCEYFLFSPPQPPPPPASPTAVTLPTLTPHIFGKAFTVAYGFNYHSRAKMDDLQGMMRDAVVSILDSGTGQPTDYTLLPSGADGNVPFGSAFQWINRDINSGYRLITALRDPSSANFYWWGHGTGKSISPGNRVALSAHQVSTNLNGRPYRLVILDACLTYSWDWANAFNIDFWPNGSTLKVSDYNSGGREPQALVGWTVQQNYPFTQSGILDLQDSLAHLWGDWQDNKPLNQCMTHYTDLMMQHGFWQVIKGYKISGCIDLRTSIR